VASKTPFLFNLPITPITYPVTKSLTVNLYPSDFKPKNYSLSDYFFVIEFTPLKSISTLPV